MGGGLTLERKPSGRNILVINVNTDIVCPCFSNDFFMPAWTSV